MNTLRTTVAAGCLTALAVIAMRPDAACGEAFPEVKDAETRRIAAIAKATQPTISVFAKGGRGGGSGVVISPDGYALTNFHVVKPAGNYMQCSMPDGKLYDAVIVGIDPVGDVALIQLAGRDDFPAAVMADSDEVRAGDWCFAIGNPFLLATDFQPTVSWGIVSGVHRYQYPAGTLLEYADCIQTDAAINPGNSGGPLFNADGDLIGVNGRGSFEKRGRVNVGVGYAISINQIKKFLGYLKSGRIVDHATLGATVTTDDETGAVVVDNILDTSDAYRRGLRYGDEIVAFGGRPIRTVNGFKNVLGIYPKGWRVPLSFVRDGERRDVLVRLAGVHRTEELVQKTQGPGEKIPRHDRPKKKDPDLPEGPKDDPEPGEKRPDDERDDDLPKGLPTPEQIQRLLVPKQSMPPSVKKLYKEKTGYANYYFNELNRDRIWKKLTAQTDLADQGGDWRLVGELTEGGGVDITLKEEAVAARIDGAGWDADLTKDFDQATAPQNSGGLLTALWLWRRMLTVGPEKFGDVYYLGAAPLIGHEELADVLVGVYDVVEVRFYFDQQSSRLIALEFFRESDDDACEILFEDYREVQGQPLPHLMKVLYGDDVYGVIRLKEYQFTARPEKEA